jgi:tetratricopeptide (TPR) repeat protein
VGESHPRVMTFVALGGEGKTALVANWAVGLAAKGWPECEAALGWSFYSQGTREQIAASSDLFLAEALKFFGAPTVEGFESAHDKGRRLAKWIGGKQAILILDGLEPLQYSPTSPTRGELKDEGLRALLKGLAQRNRGLCLVTTRYAIKDLEGYAEGAPQHDLAPLSKAAGARLLESLGVSGTRQEREKLTEEVGGHALTLNIIGSYLRDAYGGEVRQRGLIKPEDASVEERGRHAFRAMDAYVEWFEGQGDKGARALAILRLIGLFDRPANAGCLAALMNAPAIDGLTEPLVVLNKSERNAVLTRLVDAKLVTVNRDAGGALVTLDAHPLLREYFASELREGRPEAWQAAHRRLYEHLTATTQDKPEPTLDDLQPLYHAVAHRCRAGLQQEACDKVYRGRIMRGTGPDGFYSVNKLGAFGADLGAVACFFDPPWRRVSPSLTRQDQGWLLNEAALYLRTLGRLADALEPMRAALALDVEDENWKDAAQSAASLSQLELTLGDIRAAISSSAVAHANRSGNAFQRIVNRTTHADALHQAGRRAEAAAQFVEAEVIEAKEYPDYPELTSVQGFRYCDLLLGDAERAAWQLLEGGGESAPSAPLEACDAVSTRAARTLKWMQAWSGASLLTISVDYLTLARAALYKAILSGERAAGEHMKEAVDLLRRSGAQAYFLPGLLTRAVFRATTGASDGAREDLDEAFEVAERGPMRLFLADIHLHRARLFGLMADRRFAYPWVSPRDDLDKAHKLIEECGYGRRREELADAAAAWQRIYGNAVA